MCLSDEYTRSIFNAGLQYSLRQPRIGLNHQFRFLDISYVYLPWISDAFRDQFLQSTNILKYSYENHFIVGLGYSGNYTSYRARNPLRSYWNVYYNVETAGNLLRGLAQPLRFKIDQESGNYELFNTQFAQFAKADLSVTYNQMLHPKHRLVFHADFGVAVPYGNSQTIPFEKRYFAGGANSATPPGRMGRLHGRVPTGQGRNVLGREMATDGAHVPSVLIHLHDLSNNHATKTRRKEISYHLHPNHLPVCTVGLRQ